MTDVAFRETPGRDYLWRDADFAWDDPRFANRTVGELSVFAYQLDVARDLKLEERRSATFALSLADALIVLSERRSAFTLQPIESLAIDDAFDRAADFTLRFKQACAFKERCQNKFRLNASEDLLLGDVTAFDATLNAAEDLALQSTYTDIIGFILRFAEAFFVSEGVAKTTELRKEDAFAMADALIREVGVNVLRDLAFDEDLLRRVGFTRNLNESLPIDQFHSMQPAKGFDEAFRVTDAHVRNFNKIPVEPMGINEEMSRVTSFVLRMSEVLDVKDPLSNNLSKQIAEFMAVYDGIQRAGDFVISDMMLSSDNMTLENFKDFLDYGNVPGYERWRDFIPGEYEYSEAMFRAVVESQNSDRGFLTGMQVTVDVPDLIDRGQATVTVPSIGVRVTFARQFHVIPEITLAIRGGVGLPGTPKITAIDKLGFNAIIENATTFALTTGSFTWAAHGY